MKVKIELTERKTEQLLFIQETTSQPVEELAREILSDGIRARYNYLKQEGEK